MVSVTNKEGNPRSLTIAFKCNSLPLKYVSPVRIKDGNVVVFSSSIISRPSYVLLLNSSGPVGREVAVVDVGDFDGYAVFLVGDMTKLAKCDANGNVNLCPLFCV